MGSDAEVIFVFRLKKVAAELCAATHWHFMEELTAQVEISEYYGWIGSPKPERLALSRTGTARVTK